MSTGVLLWGLLPLALIVGAYLALLKWTGLGHIRSGVLVFAGIGFTLYVLAVWLAGYYSVEDEVSRMPPILIEGITVIGAGLALNFGATFGIEVKQMARASLTWTGLSLGQLVRLLGAFLYFASLLLASWWWWQTGWEQDLNNIVRTIPEQSRRLIGIVAGAITVVFSWD